MKWEKSDEERDQYIVERRVKMRCLGGVLEVPGRMVIRTSLGGKRFSLLSNGEDQ